MEGAEKRLNEMRLRVFDVGSFLTLVAAGCALLWANLTCGFVPEDFANMNPPRYGWPIPLWLFIIYSGGRFHPEEDLFWVIAAFIDLVIMIVLLITLRFALKTAWPTSWSHPRAPQCEGREDLRPPPH
jgi:hypothetical protein